MLRSVAILGLLALVLLPAQAQETETIEVDRCIAGKCHRNGRYREVLITPERFIVYIDANRCPGQDTYCPTSYAGFSAPDGTELDSGKYIPGEKTRDTIKVYVPRQYKGLYVKGINGSSRDDFLALTDFEDFSQARAVEAARPEVETSLDALFERLTEAHVDLDAMAAASAYAADASYMPQEGPAHRGREAIETMFAALFDESRERGETLRITFEHGARVIEGRVAYETGTYTLTVSGADGARSDRRKYVVVARYTKGLGWRFAVDAYSPAP